MTNKYRTILHAEGLAAAVDAVLIGGLTPGLKDAIEEAVREGATIAGILAAGRRQGACPLMLNAMEACAVAAMMAQPPFDLDELQAAIDAPKTEEETNHAS